MVFWTIQIILISFILIFLVHHLIQFFTDTLTVPKIKDLVNDPGKKYKKMYEILSKNESKSYHDKSYDNIYLQPSIMKEDLQTTDINVNNSINVNNGINANNSINANTIKNENANNSSMKDELKNFLKNQLSPDHAGSTSLDSLSFQML